MEEITFIIADNHDLCRLGLGCIIRDQFKNSNIEPVANKSELRKALANHDSAVVVIDFESMDFDKIDETAILSFAFPQAKWLFVSDRANETFLMPLTASFARANFILKSGSYDEIATALQATTTDKKFFCSEALHIIMEGHNRRKDATNKRSLLTATEMELVQLLAQGKTTKEIADERCLSHHTINTHRKNIFRKLEVNSVQELIKYALKNGLVDLTEYYI